MKDGPIIKEKPKKQNRMQLRLLLFLFLVLALLTAVPYYLLFHSQKEGFLLRSYTYAAVDSRTFTRHLNVSGSVEPREEAVILSPFSGVLSHIHVVPGQSVQEGDLLLEIEPQDLIQEMKKIEESLETMKQEIQDLKEKRELEIYREELDLHQLKDRQTAAQKDLELKEKLYALGTISRKELDEAQATLDALLLEEEQTLREQTMKQESYERKRRERERDLQRTKEEHTQLLEELEKGQIASPINGLVVELMKEEQSSLNRSDKLVHIINVDSSIVVLKMGEADIARIEEGQRTRIRAADTLVDGSVDFISPQTERGQDGAVVRVDIVFQEIPPHLRAYSTAVVEFQLTRRENIPYLPRGDYLTSGEYSFVYVIDDQTARREMVSFGQHEGTYIEVLSGLQVGEEIITSSYEDFKDRREITINREGGRPH